MYLLSHTSGSEEQGADDVQTRQICRYGRYYLTLNTPTFGNTQHQKSVAIETAHRDN